jgi:hypothetical protein
MCYFVDDSTLRVFLTSKTSVRAGDSLTLRSPGVIHTQLLSSCVGGAAQGVAEGANLCASGSVVISNPTGALQLTL